MHRRFCFLSLLLTGPCTLLLTLQIVMTSWFQGPPETILALSTVFLIFYFNHYRNSLVSWVILIVPIPLFLPHTSLAGANSVTSRDKVGPSEGGSHSFCPSTVPLKENCPCCANTGQHIPHPSSAGAPQPWNSPDQQPRGSCSPAADRLTEMF